MTDEFRPLAITMGDPAGCGPQITAAAWTAAREHAERAFYVVGPARLYEAMVPVRTISSPSEAAGCFGDALPVLPVGEDLPVIKAGEPDSSAAAVIIRSIEIATAHAHGGDAAALVTNPINKALLYDAGFSHPGHTEFIAELCGAERPVMMLVGGGLKVALATIHIPLTKVIDALSTDALVEIGETVSGTLQRDFALPHPRIVFTGLNPHAGESGAIGREEIEIINPAAEQLRASGVDIADARPADTVFAEALAGSYDAVIAMTHDQGLIPVKTLDIWGGVNTTLGLPIIRTSPDHGTAYEAAAKGTARPDSLIAALGLAREMVSNRARPNA